MTPDALHHLLAPIGEAMAGQTVDSLLAARLEARFPAHGPALAALEAACLEAIAQGWLCDRGAPECRYGRLVKPEASPHKLSVDAVLLTEVAGPFHSHPLGEICLVLPQDAAARFDGADFDGTGRGWMVNAPGSAHRPTVSGGRALVLYWLPEGRIDFARP